MFTTRPHHRAQRTVTRSGRTTRALARWLGQRYRLGWRTHPILYLADTVCGALFLGSLAAAHTGALPWWTVAMVFIVGAIVGAAAFFVQPWPPFPIRPDSRDMDGDEPRPSPGTASPGAETPA